MCNVERESLLQCHLFRLVVTVSICFWIVKVSIRNVEEVEINVFGLLWKLVLKALLQMDLNCKCIVCGIPLVFLGNWKVICWFSGWWWMLCLCSQCRTQVTSSLPLFLYQHRLSHVTFFVCLVTFGLICHIWPFTFSKHDLFHHSTSGGFSSGLDCTVMWNGSREWGRKCIDCWLILFFAVEAV